MAARILFSLLLTFAVARAEMPASAPTVDVVLTGGGEVPRRLFPLMVEQTGRSRNDAAALVREAPQLLKTGLERAVAEALVGRIVEAGGTAEIHPAGTWHERVDVVLLQVGPNRLSVAEVVREYGGTSTEAAVALVDRAPVVLQTQVGRLLAGRLMQRLAALGAVVEQR